MERTWQWSGPPAGDFALEDPIGKVLYETSGWITYMGAVRFPSGRV